MLWLLTGPLGFTCWISFATVFSLNSGEILNKLKSKGFLASSVSLYDSFTPYPSLPHNHIDEKLS